jgi:WD40 repeat protein/serine/threonine protein kinase
LTNIHSHFFSVFSDGIHSRFTHFILEQPALELLMCVERAKNEESIYYRAISKPPKERNAYIKAACGEDRSLLARIEALLKAREVKDSFLEAPDLDSDVTLDTSPMAEAPGSIVGNFKLLEKIGEGGMAVVYMAEQKQPIRRKVALKIIKLGMDTRQVIARFEAERQALAVMDHPNIAKVFDAGSTDTGRPYFVMELVKGVSITEYCEKNKLSVRERLGLFIPVCNAIQHAHQKGIIHRDIKPSNVMVTLHDGKPVPKIIDFGIAKATNRQLTEKTLFTRYAQMIGTPTYMSPEQAEMSGLDIDTRTDIYSLGILLYELLTGSTPFDAEKLLQAGYIEIQRIIREEEALRPSTKLSTLGETLTIIAERRNTAPDMLRKQVSGDLDWIVMKSLEKDRTRRYETANSLAVDVQRHLNHESVLAGSPGTLYRMSKFVHKHRAVVVTITAVAAALVLGLIASTVLYYRSAKALKREEIARAQAEDAKNQESAARVDAETARSIANEQRQRAEYLLARAQIERGVKHINEGDYHGLLDLVDAYETAEDTPEVRDQAARLWAVAYELCMDRLVHILPGSQDISYSPDGRLLALVQRDHRTARIFKTQTGQPQGSVMKLDKKVHALAFSPDAKLLVTHSVQGVGQLWETATARPAGPILKHNGAPLDRCSKWHMTHAKNAAAFNPNGTLLATAGLDGTVRLWRTDTSRPYGEPLQHDEAIWSVAFSPDGKRLVCGSREIRVWDVATRELCCSPVQHGTEIFKLVFSQGQEHVAAIGCWDQKINILNIRTGQLRQYSPVHYINDIAFSPDGTIMAAGSLDWYSRFLDLGCGQIVGKKMHHQSHVYSVQFSPDGLLLATKAMDQTVRLWEVPSGQPYGYPLNHPGRVSKPMAVFSPDGEFLASSGFETARIWRTRQRLQTEVVPYRNGDQLGALSPDGKMGAIVSGNTVLLWDTTAAKSIGRNLSHEGQVTDVVFSPDSRFLATTSADQERVVRLWKVSTGEQIEPSIKMKDRALSPTFSPDGKLLVVGELGWSSRVFEFATGRLVRIFDSGDWAVDFTFRPDVKVLGTAVIDGTVQFWDMASGRRLDPSLEHEGGVLAAAYSPDGNMLLTVTMPLQGDKRDRVIRLWDVSGEPPYHSLMLPFKSVNERTPLQSFTTDGTLLLERLPSQTARVWRLPQTPSNLQDMKLRTWIALGSQRDPQREVSSIDSQQWQQLREKLTACAATASHKDDLYCVPLSSEPESRQQKVDQDLRSIWRRVLDKNDPETLHFINSWQSIVRMWMEGDI